MVKPGPVSRRFFTTSEIARYCEVSNDGVLKWIKGGKLRAFATPGGHYRVSSEDFREFLSRYDFPIQESFFQERMERHAHKVLIVDDEPDQREILSRRLHAREPGWVLDEAADGYEAGIKIGARRPDLVILDLMMPRIDGLALCRTIRANRGSRNVRIIAVTADPDEQTRAKALEAGANACLTKPVDFELLHREIVRLMNKPARRRPRPERSL
jgi:excisionase family DNA binding protein